MWPAIVAANKGYAGYQKKTTRPFPSSSANQELKEHR